MQADIDVSFDSIYHDFESAPERRGSAKGVNDNSAKRGSKIFSRKSFSSGGAGGGDSPAASNSNYLSASNPAFEDTDYSLSTNETSSPSSRRNSSGSKLLKVFSFSPKAGGTPSTEGTSSDGYYEDANGANRRVSFSPGSAAGSESEDASKQAKRKSSSVFRKFSFTS